MLPLTLVCLCVRVRVVVVAALLASAAAPAHVVNSAINVAGRLLASISSRPGQSGRSDGYILEGEELAFYKRKLRAK
jgi:small subunit ribosomal protein S8e